MHPCMHVHHQRVTAPDHYTHSFPQGPTLTLRIASYSLVRDVASSQARPRIPQNAFKTPPLLVMNNFSGQEHLRLTSTLFQAMFPSINVHTVKLSACQVSCCCCVAVLQATLQNKYVSTSIVTPSGCDKIAVIVDGCHSAAKDVCTAGAGVCMAKTGFVTAETGDCT